jgi:hypothetical protein
LIGASLQHRVVRLQNSPAVAEPTAAPSISA